MDVELSGTMIRRVKLNSSFIRCMRPVPPCSALHMHMLICRWSVWSPGSPAPQHALADALTDALTDALADALGLPGQYNLFPN